MGYTRYWARTNKHFNPAFLIDVGAVLNQCKQHDITICGPDGTGAPVINSTLIALNGTRENELEHESFVLQDPKSEDSWDFCKTARKPYDYAVESILHIAEKHGIVKDVSSDGPNHAGYSDQDYIDGNIDWDTVSTD